MEETAPKDMSRRQQKKDYGRFVAAIVADAILGIETSTGRKVMSLTIPKPCNFDDPDKNPTINVRFAPDAGKPRKTIWNRLFGMKPMSPADAAEIDVKVRVF